MFAAPLSRMLWKEYRSLRPLWFGCALGTLGLWLLMFVVSVLSSDTTGSPTYLLAAYWSLALWLPAIYLLGCTVATFAGEKEERTADWLIHTAKPFGSLFAAKVIWPVVSAAIMQLLLFGAAASVRLSFLAYQDGPFPADEMLPELPALAAFALLEALVWGLFWSLQTTRPMPAAVMAAICIVLVNLGTINYQGAATWEPYLAPWSVLRTAGVVILFLADIGLARRWILGRGVEWSVPWHQFTVHRRASQVITAVEPSVPWRRAWQRFRWLELQSVRLFLIGTVLWSIVSTLPVFFWPKQAGPGPLIISLFLLPLFIGMAAWQGEQSRFQFRFLAYRGVSPIGLWLNKLVVWFVAYLMAITILVLFNFFAHVLGMAVFERDGNVELHLQRIVSNFTREGSIFISLFLTLFCSAFTAGLYFRRSIFAFGAGLILQIAFFYWSIATYSLNIPFWLAVLPLTVWLLWCGYRHLPRWYLERAGWPWNAIILSEWVVFPSLFAAAVMAYWVYSVPLPNIEQIRAAQARPFSVYASNQFDREWGTVFAESNFLELKRNELLHAANQNLDASVASVPEALWPELEPAVKHLRDALLKPNGMGLQTHFGDQHAAGGRMGTWTNISIQSLMQLADQETAAGQLDSAILSIRAAVRYAGAIYADKPASLQLSATSPSSLYSVLERWVRRPDVTPEIVQRTLSELEKHELRWWMPDPLQLELRYQNELNELDRLEHSLGYRKWLLKPYFARQRRVLACELSNQLRFLRNPVGHRTLDNTLTSALNHLSDDPAWAFQKSRYPNWQNEPPVGLTSELVQSLWDRETRIRGTFAMMAAEAFRKQHGRLPNDLSEVVPSIASRELLTDPWTGTLLQIQPLGISGEPGTYLKLMDSMGSIRPGVPFIWSPGPYRFQIRQTSYANANVLTHDLVPAAQVPGNFPSQLRSFVFPLWTDAIPPQAEQPAENPQPSMTPQGGSLQREDQPVDALQPQ